MNAFKTILLMLAVGFSSSCKKIPAVSTENEFDPYHPEFVVKSVSSLQFRNSPSSKSDPGIYWSNPAYSDGNILYVFSEEKNEDIPIDTLYSENNFYDRGIFLGTRFNFKFSVRNVANVADTLKKSSPASISFHQGIRQFYINSPQNNQIEFQWNSRFSKNMQELKPQLILAMRLDSETEYVEIFREDADLKKFTYELNEQLPYEFLYFRYYIELENGLRSVAEEFPYFREFYAPSPLFVEHLSDSSSVKIFWDDYDVPVDMLYLYQHFFNEDGNCQSGGYSERVDSTAENSFFMINNLQAGHCYFFEVEGRIGKIPSSDLSEISFTK